MIPNDSPRTPPRGITLISVLISLVIVTVGFYFYSQSLAKNHEMVLRTQDLAVGTRFASELLEVFHGMKGSDLDKYLFSNLEAGKFSLGNIPLCAHINILDRASGSTFNPDSIAALPSSNPLNRGTPATAANRYYQVQIVDSTTLAPVVPSPCGNTVAPVFNFAANPNARYMVTVSVTWVPRGKTVQDIQRAVVSTILPSHLAAFPN